MVGNGTMTELDRLRVEADALRAEAKTKRQTEEQKEAARLRREIEDLRAEIRDAERDEMGRALDARVEAIRAELGGKVPVRGVMDDKGADDHTFVLVYAGSRAFTTWEAGMGQAHGGIPDPKTKKKVDLADVNKAFALALVHEWNGEPVKPGTDAYARLSNLFDDFGGIANALCMVGREMSGAAKEARKS